jgi:hypothetical protein
MLRSTRSFVRTKSSLALVAAGLTVAVGCGSPATSVSIDSDASEQAAEASIAVVSAPEVAQPLDQLLVGTWLGQAVLDEGVLERKLEGKPEALQERMVVHAENFLSTEMAMEFHSDGTVESEVEMTPVGQRAIRDATVGQWRVTQIDADRLAVETAELGPDGSANITKRTFRFYPDRNAFVMTVPVSGDLEGCDAMIIFERQSAIANVAQQPAATQRK